MTTDIDWLLPPPGAERTVLLVAGVSLAAWLRPCIETGNTRLQAIAIHHQWPDLTPLFDAFPGDAGLLPPPVPTRGLHPVSLGGGRLQLLLAVGTLQQWLPQLRSRVDGFLLGDDAIEAEADAPRTCRAMARLAASGARLVAAVDWPAAALRAAGFETQPGGTAMRALWRPRFAPRAGRVFPAQHDRHAVVVGAGLAGCAMAQALAEQGWRCTLVERHMAPAQEASGNPGGLFHGVVHAADGAHARFHRAAALLVRAAVRQAIDRHGALGSTEGLLRLQTDGRSHHAMRDLLLALRLPADYVQALDADEASARCGLRLTHPAWFYPGGGWVQPQALSRSLLARAGDALRFVTAREVHRLDRQAGNWHLIDDAGSEIATAPVVVLANAADATRLLGAGHWQVHTVRGQISTWEPRETHPALPRMPVAGRGWLLPMVAGQMVFGATSQAGDLDATVRGGDHELNLAQLRRLSPHSPQPDASALRGRVGWRFVTADRLPLIGPVADDLTTTQPLRLHEVPRRDSLYLLAALGSRGIAGSVLGAKLIAAQVAGAALPLEAALVDAVDPARFIVRQARRNARQH